MNSNCFFFSEGRLASSYLCYKIVISLYFALAYIISHVNYFWQEVKYCSFDNHLTTIDEHFTSTPLTTIENSSTISQLEQTTLNLSKTEELNGENPTLYSKWPYYWIYFSNWCFGLFTISLIIDASLVTRRYLKENKVFETSVGLEQW